MVIAQERLALPGAERDGEEPRRPAEPGVAAHVDVAPQLGLARRTAPGAARHGRASEHEVGVVQFVEDAHQRVQGELRPALLGSPCRRRRL